MNPTIPDWLEPFVLFLKNHTLLVPFTIWLGAFIESFAFVGILTPGTLILPALGFVAGTLNQPMIVVFFACYLGAVAGDTSSYFLGRYCKDPILNLPQVKPYHPLILQAEKHFQRFGPLSLVIGRFLGPLRPILPFFAGSLKMSFRFFLGLNLVTGILWAILYCMLGYYAGIATLEVIQ